jgi:hypothetical protein
MFWISYILISLVKINFTIGKLINKDQTVVNENANKDSDVFNTQRDLTAGIVGKSIGFPILKPLFNMPLKSIKQQLVIGVYG